MEEEERKREPDFESSLLIAEKDEEGNLFYDLLFNDEKDQKFENLSALESNITEITGNYEEKVKPDGELHLNNTEQESALKIKSDIERVMVKGESGFLSVCWKGDKTYAGKKMGFPEWSPTKRTLTWENGAQVQFFSAEEPERLRGPQFELAWCDETAAWNKDMDTWQML